MSDIITTLGKHALLQGWLPEQTTNIKYIWLTDNSGAPAITDTTADFCNSSTDELAILEVDTQLCYKTGTSVIYLGLAGKATGNFNILKMGLVTAQGVLVAESTLNITKANDEVYTFGMELTI